MLENPLNRPPTEAEWIEDEGYSWPEDEAEVCRSMVNDLLEYLVDQKGWSELSAKAYVSTYRARIGDPNFSSTQVENQIAAVYDRKG